MDIVLWIYHAPTDQKRWYSINWLTNNSSALVNFLTSVHLPTALMHTLFLIIKGLNSWWNDWEAGTSDFTQKVENESWSRQQKHLSDEMLWNATNMNSLHFFTVSCNFHLSCLTQVNGVLVCPPHLHTQRSKIIFIIILFLSNAFQFNTTNYFAWFLDSLKKPSTFCLCYIVFCNTV